MLRYNGFAVMCLMVVFLSGASFGAAPAAVGLAEENLEMGSVFFHRDIFAGETNPEKLVQNLRYCVLYDFAMNFLRGKRGDGPAMVEAMTRIECPPNIPADERNTYCFQLAEKLLRVLEMLRFNSSDIPENPSGDVAKFRLGQKDNSFTFSFKRLKDIGWVADASMLGSPEFLAAYEKAKDKQKLRASEETSYLNGMESPKFALRTFYCGVNEIMGYDMEDAISVLNLPDMGQALRSQIGRPICVELYRMLKFATNFELTAMSSDPSHESPIVLLTDMNGGLITLVNTVDSATGKKAWKIDIDSAKTFNAMYQEYMFKGMSKDIDTFVLSSLPAHIELDDFFWVHAGSRWQKTVMGLSAWKWPIIVIVLLISLLLMPFIRLAVRGLMLILRIKGITSQANLLGRNFILPIQISVLAYLWLQGIIVVTASPVVAATAMFVMECILTITFAWLAWLTINAVILWTKERIHTTRQIAVDMLGYLIKLVVLILLMLRICDIFSLDGTKFFAALGIGGLAVAMAGKEAIANLIGTMLIMVDRPFHIRDLIKIGEMKGTVERVGLRSTLIRTFDDSCVMIPNAQFTDMDVENLSKRKWRHYRLVLGVLYSTPPETLKKFVSGLQQLVKDNPNTMKDETRCFVHVCDLGDSAIQIMANLYFHNEGLHQEYRDREQFVISALQLAESMGVSYAFPSRSIYIENTSPEQPDLTKVQ